VPRLLVALAVPPPRTTESSERSSKLVLLAYAALALLVVFGVLRARENREPPKPVKKYRGYDPMSAAAPPADPYVPSPYAPSRVRWCDAARAIHAKCERCHSAPPRLYGAPFPLLTYADTQLEYPPGSGQLVSQRMYGMIAHGRMPPLGQPMDPPVEPLTDAELDILLVWLREGALPYGGEACGSFSSGSAGSAGTAGSAGSAGTAGTAGSAGAPGARR